jgi:LPXTG-motif cell wall-anchored protein
VKKAAAISASVALGALSALAPTLGAQAATITTPCAQARYTDALQNFHSSNTNWFDTCIPQYGRGKTEFTITSDVDFPADFKPLNDANVTVSANFNPEAAHTYFSQTSPTAPFGNLARLDGLTTPKSQTYRFTDDGVVLRISKVESILPSALPAACTAGGAPFTYTMAYKVTYLPTVITFDQVIAGEHWKYKVTAAPAPTYLGMSPNEMVNSPMSDTDAACWSDGTHTVRASSSSDTTSFNDFLNNPVTNWTTIANTGISRQSPYPYTDTPVSLGTFGRYYDPPALANTGADARPALLAGLGLLMAGLIAAFVTRRRSAR